MAGLDFPRFPVHSGAMVFPSDSDGFCLNPDAFESVQAPGTDRMCLRLTSGPAFHYPLYYYIPSVTADGRTLVLHRYDGRETQLVALDLTTGESRGLTAASAPDGTWHPWCGPSGIGVMDHRSALNPVTSEVVYFDGPVCRAVQVDTGEDRECFRLPEGRIPIGQNCLRPDGSEFIYIHHDRESYDEVYLGDRRDRWRSEGAVLAAHHFETGRQREILRIKGPIHHVMPFGRDHLVFCHPATEGGMLWTDYAGGWYSHLRTRDAEGGEICHYLSTRRGLSYEVRHRQDGIQKAGLYNPFTHVRREFDLPSHFGYTHTGKDPEGRFWFFESCSPPPWEEPNPHRHHHALYAVKELDASGTASWERLTNHWPTYGEGQKSHFHPQLTPDRKWILFVAGDPDTGTNHIHLLSVDDLETHDAYLADAVVDEAPEAS